MEIITFTELRGHLKEFLNKTSESNEPIFIKRRDKENAVLLSSKIYDEIIETIHLLSDERNITSMQKSIHDLKTHNLKKVDI